MFLCVKKMHSWRGKAVFYDLFIDLEHSTNLRTTAKELDVPERRFVRFLLEKRFVYRTHPAMFCPMPMWKNTGLFCVKDYCNHGHTGSYTLVTPKGKKSILPSCGNDLVNLIRTERNHIKILSHAKVRNGELFYDHKEQMR